MNVHHHQKECLGQEKKANALLSRDCHSIDSSIRIMNPHAPQGASKNVYTKS